MVVQDQWSHSPTNHVLQVPKFNLFSAQNPIQLKRELEIPALHLLARSKFALECGKATKNEN